MRGLVRRGGLPAGLFALLALWVLHAAVYPGALGAEHPTMVVMTDFKHRDDLSDVRGEMLASPWSSSSHASEPRPDRRDDLVALLEEVQAASRRDEGCLHYGYYTEITDPSKRPRLSEPARVTERLPLIAPHADGQETDDQREQDAHGRQHPGRNGLQPV